MDQLVAGKLDMAFIAHIISPFSKASNIDAYQLDHYRLYTLVVDNYHAIVSRRHRFAGLDVVTWQDLAEEKLVILDKSYGLKAIIRESFPPVRPAAQHRLRVRPGGRHPGDGGGKFRDLHPLQAALPPPSMTWRPSPSTRPSPATPCWWSPRRWRPASGWPAALSATSWIITGTTPPAPAGSRSLRPPRPGGSRHSPPSRTVRQTEREGGAFCPALPLDRASSPWYNGQNHKGDCPGTWRQTF